MSKLAIFSFHKGGSLEEGFKVTLRIGEDGKSPSQEIPGELPPAPELLEIYNRWRLIYPSLGFSLREIRFRKQSSTSLIGKDEARELADKLNNNLNNWLKSKGFIPLGRAFERELNRSENIRVIIQTADIQLQRLPWHLWDTLMSYKNAEIAFISNEYEHLSHLSTNRKKGRILAVLGNSVGIDIKEDRKFLEDLEKDTQAEIQFLVEPDREILNKSLRDNEGWDIFFFAGHSFSQTDNKNGYIFLNKNDHITFDDLEYALKKSVENGLRLAIFNSCDGLGLAKKLLTKYSIPQLIVMREPIPDQVAQKFLKEFLSAFANGKSLNIAMQTARQSLQAIEKDFICASWLPVLFQNPAEVPPTWQDLHGVRVERQQKNRRNKVKLALAATALALIGITGSYFAKAIFAPIRDNLSYGEEILFTESGTRDKLRAVELFAGCKEPLRNYLGIFSQRTRKKWQDCFLTTDNYQKAFNLLSQSWKQSHPDPETLIYLNNALLDANQAKYHTMAVIIPIVQKPNGSRDTALAKELLRGFAQAQTEVNLGLFDRNDELAQDLPGQNLLEGQAINGFGLKVLIVDSANNEQQAKQIANLISKQRNILGVVGSYSSEVTMAMVDILNSNNLVLISPGSTTYELTEEPRDYFFRLAGNTQLEAESLANYLIQEGQKQAAIFYNPRSPFTYSLWKDFKKIFEQKGGKVLKINQFDLTKSSFNAEKAIKELQSKGETAIVLFPDGEVTDAQNNAINLIEANNGRNWIVGASTLYSAKTLEIGELPALEKLVVFQQWHRSDSPEFSAKSNTFWKGYINENTAAAYDATRTLIEALSKSKRPTRKGIQQTLADPKFKVCGVTGKIQFDSPKSGDRKNPPVRLVDVEKANNEYGLKFVPIEGQIPISDKGCDID
ncbi:MAG: ABC transporter substrate-binding protein [Xenococcus sp. MO_188.B8]|nr:ABC transporter substrate-binding protein [Xenococcus sp. MO_188.B8]